MSILKSLRVPVTALEASLVMAGCSKTPPVTDTGPDAQVKGEPTGLLKARVPGRIAKAELEPRRADISRALYLCGMLAAAAGPLAAQDSYDPNPDQLAIHRTTLKDAVRISVTAASTSNASVSLDPYVRAVTDSDWGPGTGRRLSKDALDALLRATAIREVCEPVVRDACRGRIRGTVFRLTDLSLQGDSAQAIILATAARSEFDRTILVPRIRYYVYQLKRQDGEWAISKAQRGLTFLPPNVLSSGKP